MMTEAPAGTAQTASGEEKTLQAATQQDKKSAQAAQKKWYIVHAFSNFERRVAEAIRYAAREAGMEDEIGEVLVPMEEVNAVERGRRVKRERRYFPGYVLVHMVMNEATYHIVSSLPRVSGFLGGEKKPKPISQAEVDRIQGIIEQGVSAVKSKQPYEIGQTLRVTDGPFASFVGVVEQVDEETDRLKVAVSIFGRATLLELSYHQVEKVD